MEILMRNGAVTRRFRNTDKRNEGGQNDLITRRNEAMMRRNRYVPLSKPKRSFVALR